MLDVNAWITLVVQLTGLVVAFVGALWAYTKYALERALIAPTEFTIEASHVGSSSGTIILEVLLHLANVGTAPLVATNLRVDILYLNYDDEVITFNDPRDKRFGRVKFMHSTREDIMNRGASHPPLTSSPSNALPHESGQDGPDHKRGFPIINHDTFIQPRVDQTYTFVTSLPETGRYVLVWGSFQYAQRPGKVQQYVLWISRRLGLVQYGLQHVSIPHTTERVFDLSAGQSGSGVRKGLS